MKIITLLSLLCLASTVQAVTFDAWVASYGLTGDNASSTADPDGDGVPNLMEYALDGLDPTKCDIGKPCMPSIGFLRRYGNAQGQWEWTGSGRAPTDGVGGKWHLGMRFTARPGVEGIKYIPQLSTTLTRWFDGRSATAMEMIPGNVVQAVARVQGNRYTGGFMRLRVKLDESVGDSLSGIHVSGIPTQALITDSPSQQLRSYGSATSTTVTTQDLTVQRETAASRVTDWLWNWRPANNNIGATDVTRTSSNPAVLTPSADNPYLWQWVSNGTATIRLQTQERSYTQSITTTTQGGGTVDTVIGVEAGSLRSHLGTQLDDRLAASALPSTSLAIYSTQNHAAGTYTRNSSCWATGVDLTPVSPWNSEAGPYKAGTLISPRHVLFATHYHPEAGITIRFVKMDNTVVTRTVTAIQILSQSGTNYPDFTVGKLDSDVPAGIAFCRVLPDTWAAKLPTLAQLTVPAVCTDQEEKLLVRDLQSITSAGTVNGSMVGMRVPADVTRRSWYEDVVGGDSGNPVCLVIGNKLVLLSVLTYGGGGSGTSLVSFRTALNSAMTTLGGGYTLTDVDLSSYTSF